MGQRRRGEGPSGRAPAHARTPAAVADLDLPGPGDEGGTIVMSTVNVNGATLEWDRVKRGRPCPICEREDGLCSVSAGREFATCYRNGGPGSEQKTNKAGQSYWVHRLNGQADDDGRGEKPARKPPPARAHPDDLDDVYSALLSDPRLALTEANLEDLSRRGFPTDEARRRLYASMPARGREEIAADLAGRFGKDAVLGVPGFFVNDRGELGIAAFPGLVIPSRDPGGRIVALIVRPDKPPDPKHKYLYVSSANRDGPGPGAPAHVPLGVAGPAETVRLTEGPLKADLATILSGVPTIAAGGVTNWRPCLKVFKAIEGKIVRMAFDADWRVNAKVAQSMVAAVEAIRAEGLSVEFETWDPSAGKGIDDLLARGKAPRVLAGDDAKALLREIEHVAYPGGRAAATQPAAGDGGGPRGLTVQADGLPSGRVVKDRDDPHRLARNYLRHFRHEDGLTLVHHQGELYRWNGSAYQLYRDAEPDLVGDIEDEFNRLNASAVEKFLKKLRAKGVEEPPDDDDLPKALKVTSGIVRNTLQALKSETCLSWDESAPCWLGDDDSRPDPLEVLPTRGGLVDLTTRKVMAPTPRFFSPFNLDYDFVPDAPPPARWTRFLAELFPGDEEAVRELQKWFGYVLTPRTDQHKILLMVGPPRSGKGTISRVLTRLIGAHNIINPTLASMTTNFGLQAFLGKFVAIIGDARVSGSASDKSIVIERLLNISGEDDITIDRKYKDQLTTKLKTRLMIFSNEPPNFREASTALVNRMTPFRLTESWLGREDLTLAETLYAELPGILNWAIRGRELLKEDGRLNVPSSGRALFDELKELTSPVMGFVDECCDLLPADTRDSTDLTQIRDLYHAFVEWCRETGHESGSDNIFGRNLNAAYPTLKVERPRARAEAGEMEVGEGNSRPRRYRGIQLNGRGEILRQQALVRNAVRNGPQYHN
jgi:P4 family phage/plasmid primase-like protien